jgi:hypothetical protein
VYLAPLVSELKDLWEVGVQTFDVTSKKYFTLRSVLMWTINDFPAYDDFSGWSTHGWKACHCCRHETQSMWLTYDKKWCFMGIGDGCFQIIHGEETRDDSTVRRKWLVLPKCRMVMRSLDN